MQREKKLKAAGKGCHPNKAHPLSENQEEKLVEWSCQSSNPSAGTATSSLVEHTNARDARKTKNKTHFLPPHRTAANSPKHLPPPPSNVVG